MVVSDIQPRDVYLEVQRLMILVQILMCVAASSIVVMSVEIIFHWVVYRKTIQAFKNHTMQSRAWFSMSKDYNVLTQSIMSMTQVSMEQGVSEVKKVVQEATEKAEKKADETVTKTAEAVACVMAVNPPSSGVGFRVPYSSRVEKQNVKGGFPDVQKSDCVFSLFCPSAFCPAEGQ